MSKSKARRTVLATVLVSILAVLIVGAVLFVSGALPYKIYVVNSGSMSPTIPSKSAVVVREGMYEVGQVISYRTSNGVVTHRLVEQHPDGTFSTRGDANATVDPGRISSSQIIGGVVAAPPMVGYWLVYVKNPAGLASLLVILLCLWLIYSVTLEYAEEGRVRTRSVARWRHARRRRWSFARSTDPVAAKYEARSGTRTRSTARWRHARRRQWALLG